MLFPGLRPYRTSSLANALASGVDLGEGIYAGRRRREDDEERRRQREFAQQERPLLLEQLRQEVGQIPLHRLLLQSRLEQSQQESADEAGARTAIGKLTAPLPESTGIGPLDSPLIGVQGPILSALRKAVPGLSATERLSRLTPGDLAAMQRRRYNAGQLAMSPEEISGSTRITLGLDPTAGETLAAEVRRDISREHEDRMRSDNLFRHQVSLANLDARWANIQNKVDALTYRRIHDAKMAYDRVLADYRTPGKDVPPEHLDSALRDYQDALRAGEQMSSRPSPVSDAASSAVPPTPARSALPSVTGAPLSLDLRAGKIRQPDETGIGPTMVDTAKPPARALHDQKIAEGKAKIDLTTAQTARTQALTELAKLRGEFLDRNYQLSKERVALTRRALEIATGLKTQGLNDAMIRKILDRGEFTPEGMTRAINEARSASADATPVPPIPPSSFKGVPGKPAKPAKVDDSEAASAIITARKQASAVPDNDSDHTKLLNMAKQKFYEITPEGLKLTPLLTTKELSDLARAAKTSPASVSKEVILRKLGERLAGIEERRKFELKGIEEKEASKTRGKKPARTRSVMSRFSMLDEPPSVESVG